MRIIEGIVTSTKMKGTAAVETTQFRPHPLYKKRMRTTKRYKVDTKGMEVAVGHTVRIQEVRPISGSKNFKVIAIVPKTSKAKKTGEENV